MKKLLKGALLASAAMMPISASAESFDATIAAGHPAVFRWIKMLDEAFIPAVTSTLEGIDHEMTFTGQYGGAIAGVGEELEAVEAGLAELGICQSLFDPAKLAVQNVTYYTPFVSDDVRQVGDLMHRLQVEDAGMQQSYENNGVIYIGAPVIIDDYLLMTNFPIESLNDLDGRKIGAPGAALNWLSGTGAVGVAGTRVGGVSVGGVGNVSKAAPAKQTEEGCTSHPWSMRRRIVCGESMASRSASAAASCFVVPFTCCFFSSASKALLSSSPRAHELAVSRIRF